MLNEHIAATAIYYYDVWNLTTARLSFCQATTMEENLNHKRDLSDALGAILGISNTKSMEASLEQSEYYTTQQSLGSVLHLKGILWHGRTCPSTSLSHFNLEMRARPAMQGSSSSLLLTHIIAAAQPETCPRSAMTGGQERCLKKPD